MQFSFKSPIGTTDILSNDKTITYNFYASLLTSFSSTFSLNSDNRCPMLFASKVDKTDIKIATLKFYKLLFYRY
jgi:hypothetical protein